MQFDMKELMDGAYRFASEMVMQEVIKEPLNEDKVRMLRSPEVMGSKYGKILMENLIAGAIMEYHSLLREALLEKGIEISDFPEAADTPDNV